MPAAVRTADLPGDRPSWSRRWLVPGWRLLPLLLASFLLLPWPALAGSTKDAGQTAPTAPAQHFMVAAANPHAVDAGVAILRQGGSAVDAAIAAQLVLTLVEPQSSGIGGGAFLLNYQASTDDVTAYDGRETAPKAATDKLFLDKAGQPLGFMQAVVGGRAVGVPGVLRMLELAHRDHGVLPWAELFQPAIHLAEHGFRISPRLYALLATDKALAASPTARDYFYLPNGKPKPVGSRLRNPVLAATLRRIAMHGAAAFYRGPIAADIVATVQAAANPGLLSLADLAGYTALRRQPVCGPYREWRICGMPPPSSGGIAVLQILGMLQHFDLRHLGPGSAEAVHLVAEASRLAFADRAEYVADSDFVPVPIMGLLDQNYLARRAALIRPGSSLRQVLPGEPLPRTGLLAPQISEELPSTSHLSIVDAAGNAVAMTTSVENAFGSRLMVRGFILNNQLTDFAFAPTTNGRPVANRVAAGKRPRSSMAPTLVFAPDGKLLLAAGSPGGSYIIGFVAEDLIALLDWRLSPQQAVALPHFLSRGGPVELEAGTALHQMIPALQALGETVEERHLVSGSHVVEVTPDGLRGGADPRREGRAAGE